MSKLIEKILETDGPCDSSKLNKKLQEEGVTYDAARKQISRASDPIKKLKYIKFPHNGRFVYLDKQYNSYEFHENLFKSFDDFNSSYGLFVRSLQARQNFVPKVYVPIFSGAPYWKTGDRLSYKIIAEHLEKTGLVEEVNDENLGVCYKIGFEPLLPGEITAIRIRLRIEEFLIQTFARWLQINGLVSFNAVRTRTDIKLPSVGRFKWDVAAPSYLSAWKTFIETEGKYSVKPGFFVADVINNQEDLETKHIKYFVNKCAVNTQLPNARPIVPFLISNSFTKEALDYGRRKGFVFTTF